MGITGTRRDGLKRAAALLAVGFARPAIAQGEVADVAREDTVIGLTQPVGTTFLNSGNFHPYSAGNDPRNHIAYLLEPLFYYATFTAELIPWLATGYSYNADATALTVTLRQGTTWSDGKPVSVDDVVFTFQWLMRNPSLRTNAELNAAVVKVEATDARTVHFTFTSPQPRFLFQFLAMYFNQGLWILPKHVYETAQDAAGFTAADPAKG
jgi:peptide/nickel transport system substrate-binding protein